MLKAKVSGFRVFVAFPGYPLSGRIQGVHNQEP